jgi:serine protease 56
MVSVRLGEHDITSNNDGAQPIDVPVEWKIAHDRFDPKTVSNDVGLVKLKQTVAVNNKVRPICLPFREPLRSRDLTDYQPFIAGWGSTSFNGPSARILQQAQIPILPLAECIKNYKTSFPGQVFDDRVGDNDNERKDAFGAWFMWSFFVGFVRWISARWR